MRTQDDLNNKLNQLTQSQLQAALLEMTGDLDKAQVLQKKLPGWMVNAPPGVLDALTRDAVRVAEAQAALTLIVDGWIGARSSFFHVKTIGLPPSARMATLPLPAVIL